MGSGASKRRQVNPKLPIQNIVFTPVKQNIEAHYSSDSSRSSCEQDKQSERPDAYDISSNIIMPVASNVGNGLRRRIQHILSSPFSESSPTTSNFGSSSSNNKNLHSTRLESKTGEYIHHVGGYTDSEIECYSDVDNSSCVDVRANTLSITFQSKIKRNYKFKCCSSLHSWRRLL